jgi:ion channel-forming bestrophin family protein
MIRKFQVRMQHSHYLLQMFSHLRICGLEWFRCRRISFTNYWGLEEWEIHVSRRRYLRYIFGMPKSRLLRRLIPQLSVLFVWSAIAVTIGQSRPIPMNRGVHVPLTSLSLVSTFVAALQTIRSNQGLTRLDNARVAQQRMVVYTRDIALLLAAYVIPKNRAIGLKAARHLALFGWILKSHLRETDGNDIIDVLLPNQADAEYLKGARKKPVAIISRLRQMMAHLAQRREISSTAHRLIEDNLRNLDEVIAASDKLRATPIPPVYGAHLSRLMVFYLVFLPFALLGSSLNGLSAVATTLMVGFAMAGLDEMSSMFELPFRFMPLYQLAKVSMIDVADAFCRSPPPLNATADCVESATFRIPSYWAEKDDPFLPYDGREQRQRVNTK